MTSFLKREWIAILAVIAVGALISGYWYFSFYRPNKMLQIFQSQYQKSVDVSRVGDLDASIAGFVDALEAAPNDDAEFRAKASLASSLFKRNTGDDRAKAVAIYKDIFEETSNSPYQRAAALNQLMLFLDAIQDKEFAEKEIFNEEPLRSFMKEGSFGLAQRRTYELSYEIYPSPINALGVANWYRKALLVNNTETQKGQFLSVLKQWSDRADALLPLMLGRNYSKVQIASAYMYLGLQKGVLAKFSGTTYDPAENAYKTALQTLGDTRQDVNLYDLSLLIRYNYGSLVAIVYGDKRFADIHELLQPIIAPVEHFKDYPFSFYQFLESGMNQSESIQSRLVLLSDIDSDFRNFLVGRGFKFSTAVN